MLGVIRSEARGCWADRVPRLSVILEIGYFVRRRTDIKENRSFQFTIQYSMQVNEQDTQPGRSQQLPI